MPYLPNLPPCTSDDWDDDRRRRRMRDTRLGHSGTRFGRARIILARLVYVLVPLIVLATLYWTWDVAPVREKLALTQPQIHQVYDAAERDDLDTAVVDLVGLGNLDATPTAEALPALSEIGQVWSVQYDNSGLDTAVVSDLILERAGWSGVENVVLVHNTTTNVQQNNLQHHKTTKQSNSNS